MAWGNRRGAEASGEPRGLPQAKRAREERPQPGPLPRSRLLP